MNEKLFQRIKELTQLQATSGNEQNVRNYLRKQITPLVDEVITDGLGGIFGIRHHQDSDAPRVMVVAHMDEVGFMLTNIKKNGLFRVQPLGGWNPMVVQAQRFTLTTRKGNAIPVISGSIPPHLLREADGKQNTKVEDILFDGGFESKEEAESFGIQPGDTIVPETQTIYTANKKNIIAKAWDNRYGCTMVLEALETLKDTRLDNTLIAGANIQEEVGLRGAQVSTTLLKPDIFFAVDCSAANDISGKKDEFGYLGKGTLIRIYDPGFIMLKNMREFLLDMAQTHKIPYQYYVSKGNTDASVAHLKNNGVPSSVIGVVARYIHSHQTLFNIADFEAARELLVQVIKHLDKSTVNTIYER
ncbi:MAG: glutamyl aminopeptidase [Lactobacillales bacterium]|jgi:glutamyl aminopeptidase|nr:glutamyl aminopeptidase [Lactobacillales bacterium]